MENLLINRNDLFRKIKKTHPLVRTRNSRIPCDLFAGISAISLFTKIKEIKIELFGTRFSLRGKRSLKSFLAK